MQLKLAKWLTREVGEDEADQVIAFTDTHQVVALDTEIALAAAELGADYLTCDRNFEGLPQMLFPPKGRI